MNEKNEKTLDEILQDKKVAETIEKLMKKRNFSLRTFSAVMGLSLISTSQWWQDALDSVYGLYYGIMPLIFGGMVAYGGYIAGRELGWAEKYLTRSPLNLKGIISLALSIAYFPLSGMLLATGTAEPLLVALGYGLAYAGIFRSSAPEKDRDITDRRHFKKKYTEERETKTGRGNHPRKIREIIYGD